MQDERLVWVTAGQVIGKFKIQVQRKQDVTFGQSSTVTADFCTIKDEMLARKQTLMSSTLKRQDLMVSPFCSRGTFQGSQHKIKEKQRGHLSLSKDCPDDAWADNKFANTIKHILRASTKAQTLNLMHWKSPWEHH